MNLDLTSRHLVTRGMDYVPFQSEDDYDILAMRASPPNNAKHKARYAYLNCR